jgi:dynein heavy chain, axonemal
LIWSIGATCDNDGRKKFSDWIHERIQSEKLKMPIPKEGLVYDYRIDDGGIFEPDNPDEEEEHKKVKKVFNLK